MLSIFLTFIILFLAALLFGFIFIRLGAKSQSALKSMHASLQWIINYYTHIDLKSSETENALEPEDTTPTTFKEKYIMLLLFSFCFALFSSLAQAGFAFSAQDGSGTRESILLFLGIIIALSFLVFIVLAHYEKNICRKFWLRLIVSLELELGMAAAWYLLLSGDLFRHFYFSRLFFTIAIVPLFLESCVKTQQIWLAWQREKSS